VRCTAITEEEWQCKMVFHVAQLFPVRSCFEPSWLSLPSQRHTLGHTFGIPGIPVITELQFKLQLHLGLKLQCRAGEEYRYQTARKRAFVSKWILRSSMPSTEILASMILPTWHRGLGSLGSKDPSGSFRDKDMANFSEGANIREKSRNRRGLQGPGL